VNACSPAFRYFNLHDGGHALHPGRDQEPVYYTVLVRTYVVLCMFGSVCLSLRRHGKIVVRMMVRKHGDVLICVIWYGYLD